MTDATHRHPAPWRSAPDGPDASGATGATGERPSGGALPAVALEPLLAWLGSPRVVGPGGVVMSWWSPAGTGYPYPEAAGFWLSLACSEPRAQEAFRRAQVDAVAAWLCGEIDTQGAAGRFGRQYLFDSGIALGGLLAYEATGGAVDVRPSARRLVAFIARGAEARRAVLPCDVEPPSHWSEAFGGHLLRATLALHRWAEQAGDPASLAPARAIASHAMRLWDGARFVVSDGSVLSYLHAALYGLEALACLDARGLGAHREDVARGAAWAAQLQLGDGGLAPFWNGSTGWGKPRADVAAQAVRVWLLHDAARYAQPIARALGFLGKLQTPEGGVRYEADSGDVNTWASLFAAQALLWRASPAAPVTLC